MNNSEAAKLLGVSRSLVSRVKTGKIKSPQAKIILATLDIEKQLLDCMKSDLFIELCDVGISKAKNIDVRRFASLMQSWALNLRRGEDEVSEV